MRYTNVRFTYLLTTKYYVSSMHITMHSKVIRRTIDDRFQVCVWKFKGNR